MRNKLIDILMSKPYGQSSYEEFADYLLAEGVIVPPCKVGQTVYYPIRHTNKVMELLVREIVYEKNKLQMWASYLAFTVDAIGNTVFLTREEAEKALAERSENEHRTDN